MISLGLSIQQTGTAAPWAYFGSHTRAWELGIGALLAVFAAHLGRLPGRGATILSWAGLAAIAVAALTFTEDTPFPGYAALLPVLGAAAVIAGRNNLLGVAPMRWVGKLSYGWYLWHWPVLMIWPAAFVRDPSVTLNLLFAAGALLLALATYHLVENPLRSQPKLRARAYRGLVAGLAFSLLTVGVTVIGGRFTPPLPTGPAAPGVAAELAAASDPQARLTELIKSSTGAFRIPSNLTPTLLEPSAEMPGHYAAKCHLDYRSTKFDTCVYGDPDGDRTVFLIGDSHAAHWFPALDPAARTEGWRLVALTKSSCQMPTIVNYSGPLKRAYTECADWRDAVLARVVAEKPDLVVIASNDSDNGGLVDSKTGGIVSPKGQKDDDLWLAGWKKTWAKLKGFKVVQIQDTVRPTKTAPECLAENAWKISKCDQVKTKGIVEPHRRQIIATAAKAQGIKVIDPSPWQCATGVCPPIVGDTLVYRDGNHLSAAYARALTPLVQKAVFGQ